MSAGDEPMRELLARATTIAVVGLSSDVSRPSFSVASYMQRAGYRIIPVNPNERRVLGEVAYPSLRAILGEQRVDIVNVFRRPAAVPGVVGDAIAIGAPAVWLQPGVSHVAAEETARRAGLLVVSGECIKVKHARLVGADKDRAR